MTHSVLKRFPVLMTAALVMLSVIAGPGGAFALTGRPQADQSTKVLLPSGGVTFPKSGAWLGAYTTSIQDGDFSRASRMADFEALVGRPMAMERVYYQWDDLWPNADDYYTRDQARIPIISWGAAWRDGGYVKWADIAKGTYDGIIDARAADIKAFAYPILFVFQHEPSQTDPSGTPKDFVDAYRHIHDRFAADGVTNITYGTVLLAYTYRIGGGDLFYPGANYVDFLGADGYNWLKCNGHADPWTSFTDVFSAFHTYAVAKGKPMVIGEWGSVEDPALPAHKAAWFTAAALTIKSWPQVKGLSYFNLNANCNWLIDSSSTSLVAYQALAMDPYFNPAAIPAPNTSVGAYTDVLDQGFGSPAGFPAQGQGIQWLFEGAKSHTVTDSSGMSYFDSGTKNEGAAYTFTFVGAGRYPYDCTLHPSMTGTIKIPVVVSPASGKVTTTFTITWASGRAPAGYNYDVEIQRPSGSWTSWKTDQTAKSATFVPDSGTGTYSFQARFQKTSNGSASWYSLAASITVTR